MKKLKAIRGHSYAGKYQKTGCVYKAVNRDARVLVAIGRSEIYVEPTVVDVPKRRPRKTETTEAAPKRTYRRRDMKAETE